MTTIRRPLIAFLLLLALLAPGAGRADTAEEVRALYERFAAAQNAHDLAAVRPLFLDSPRFLWVSDGTSFWGREEALARMAGFQKSEVWRVTPDLDRAVVVELAAGSALLHLSLALEFGPRDPGPERYRFLVSLLAVRTGEGWRIAALLTTREKDG